MERYAEELEMDAKKYIIETYDVINEHNDDDGSKIVEIYFVDKDVYADVVCSVSDEYGLLADATDILSIEAGLIQAYNNDTLGDASMCITKR